MATSCEWCSRSAALVAYFPASDPVVILSPRELTALVQVGRESWGHVARVPHAAGNGK